MRRKTLGVLASMAVGATTLIGLGGAPAEAQKVANTGAGQLIFDSGQLTIGSNAFDAGSAEEQVVANINVAPNGTFTVSSVTFPPIPPIDGPLGPIDVTINVLSSSGSVNPLNGAATFNMSLRIDIDGTGVGGSCRIEPINIAASTATLGGVPYNPTTGRVTLADRTFSVPGAQGCSTFPLNVNNEINSQLGLPSGTGNNTAVFSGLFAPIRTPAVVPAFTVTPPTGVAPLAVALDASGTTSSRANPTYQWDFTNDGTFDATGVTTSTSYASPGTYTVRLRVTDDQGDLAETTRTVTVLTPLPDVTLAKAGPSGIIHGDTGTYTLSVGSEGQLPATGAQVVDTLPAGVTYAGFGGTGWTCTEAAGVVTCDSADVVAPGDTFPDLTIDVTADGSVTGVVTNTATVATPLEEDLADNTASATTQLILPGIDLDIDKVHDAEQGLFVGQRATYTLSVSNQGTQPTTSPVFLTDDLPDGLEFVSAASDGFDWICTEAADVLTCFSLEEVGPGESLGDIRVVVDVTSAASSPLSNTATVSTDGDANPGNDSATDTGEVLGFAVDYGITKLHLGDIVVGEPTTYGIAVQNVGTQAGAGTVTVTDELPAGLAFQSAGGDGWTCGAVGQTVTCTHPGGVAAGDFLPSISLQVVADASLVPSVTNTATVAGAGDANPLNDSDDDTGLVRQPQADLRLSKSHVGNFTTQSNGAYTLSVRNIAAERADGPTTVVDTLPAGLQYVGGAGTGWTCGAAGQVVTCTYAGVIPGLSNAPALTLTTFAPDGAPATVVNTATVSNAQDANAANDTATDPTRIDRRQPLPTVLKADAIVLGVQLGLLGAPTNVSLLNAPYAVLTSNGVPVPGKVVTFKVLNQTETICTAVTNIRGVATCKGPISYLTALTRLRYTASFAGDLDFAPSRDEAAIALLQGLRLL